MQAQECKQLTVAACSLSLSLKGIHSKHLNYKNIVLKITPTQVDGGVHTTAVLITTLGSGVSGFALRAANQNPCRFTVTDVQHVTCPAWRKTNQRDSSPQYKKNPPLV